MTPAKSILGMAMIATPFVALFVWAAVEGGILFAVGVYAAIALLILWIRVAVELLP